MKMVVIGSSSGGLRPTKIIVEDLPENTDAAFLVVRHSTPGGPSILTLILSSHTTLPVVEVEKGMRVESGVVYVAPPGISVTFSSTDDGDLEFALVHDTQRRLRHRPSIDLALTSAAEHFKDDCVGIVLSGYLDDGTQGAIQVDEVDGIMIAQTPTDAESPSMPLNVIIRDTPDYILPEVRIGKLLKRILVNDTDEPLSQTEHCVS